MIARLRFINTYSVDNISIFNEEELRDFFKDKDCEEFLFFPITDNDGSFILNEVLTSKKEVAIFNFTSFKSTQVKLNKYPYYCVVKKSDVQILFSEKDKSNIIKEALNCKIYHKTNKVLHKLNAARNEYEKLKKDINNYYKNKSEKSIRELSYCAKNLKNKIKELQRNLSFLRSL